MIIASRINASLSTKTTMELIRGSTTMLQWGRRLIWNARVLPSCLTELTIWSVVQRSAVATRTGQTPPKDAPQPCRRHWRCGLNFLRFRSGNRLPLQTARKHSAVLREGIVKGDDFVFTLIPSLSATTFSPGANNCFNFYRKIKISGHFSHSNGPVNDTMLPI
jgi:hypothetical protein